MFDLLGNISKKEKRIAFYLGVFVLAFVGFFTYNYFTIEEPAEELTNGKPDNYYERQLMECFELAGCQLTEEQFDHLTEYLKFKKTENNK